MKNWRFGTWNFYAGASGYKSWDEFQAETKSEAWMIGRKLWFETFGVDEKAVTLDQIVETDVTLIGSDVEVGRAERKVYVVAAKGYVGEPWPGMDGKLKVTYYADRGKPVLEAWDGDLNSLKESLHLAVVWDKPVPPDAAYPDRDKLNSLWGRDHLARCKPSDHVWMECLFDSDNNVDRIARIRYLAPLSMWQEAGFL